jgi:hypothetical protein
LKDDTFAIALRWLRTRPVQLVSGRQSLEAEMADMLNLFWNLRIRLCCVRAPRWNLYGGSEKGGPHGLACRNQSMLRDVSLIEVIDG